ncbi:HCNGP-like protein-domain-containing protein [Fomitopsis serialis]|uniref:HCNGP-like protein-domain-containing protein n=1 Tax=Fomitopsis serialis TaxID=139415 RepID=UPI0020084F79|nr:HCNGP-like protein-domain-containing protein [Neoantrodia serialis]KAH9936983.1 HCNGP-like protein-domain-containing protein [Neoantrodia serialis]
MLKGLVAYDEDSQSDREDYAPDPQRVHDKPTKARADAQSEAAHGQPRASSSSGAQVVIRRPVHVKSRPRPRRQLSDHAEGDHPGSSAAEPSESGDLPDTASRMSVYDEEEPDDELSRIRRLLRPAEIPGVEDWGVPPPPSTPCDPALEAKLTQFMSLKRNLSDPIHFNDSLMSNRSFRNPHLYTRLVEFVDVDERATNFPKELWDPTDVQDEWYADRIAEAQKVRSEQQAAQDGSFKRLKIDFASASRRPTAAAPQRAEQRPVASRGGVLGNGYGRGRGRLRFG